MNLINYPNVNSFNYIDLAVTTVKNTISSLVTKVANVSANLVALQVPTHIKAAIAAPTIDHYPDVANGLKEAPNLLHMLSLLSADLHPVVRQLQSSVHASMTEDLDKLTRPQVDRLIKNAPYSGLPGDAAGLVDNWRVLYLLQRDATVERLGLQPCELKTLKDAITDSLKKGFAELPDTPFKQQLADYDQALHRYEYGVALPAHILQLWSQQALLRYLPSSVIYSLLNDVVKGSITTETIGLRLTELSDQVLSGFDIGKAVDNQTPSKVIHDFNRCLETLSHLLGIAAAVGEFMICPPLSGAALLLGGALASSVQNELSENMAAQIGPLTLETTKVIAEATRSESLCRTINHQIDQLTPSLSPDTPAPTSNPPRTLSERWPTLSAKERSSVSKQYSHVWALLTHRNQREVSALRSDRMGDGVAMQRAFELYAVQLAGSLHTISRPTVGNSTLSEVLLPSPPTTIPALAQFSEPARSSGISPGVSAPLIAGTTGVTISLTNSAVQGLGSRVGSRLLLHPIKTALALGAVVGVTLAGAMRKSLMPEQSTALPTRVEQDLLDLLTHTTHGMPVDGQPLRSTADKVQALIVKDRDAPNARALQSEVIRVLRADGIFESTHAALGFTDETEPSTPPRGGVQALPLALDELDVAKAVIEVVKILDHLNTAVEATLRQQDERLFYQALQKQWREDPALSWLASASEEQQLDWLQLNTNREYASGKVSQYLQAPQQKHLQVVQDSLRQAGLGSWTPEQIHLSRTRRVQGQSLPANITLAEFAQRGVTGDQASPWLTSGVIVQLETGSGLQQATPAQAEIIRLVLQDTQRRQSSYVDEIDQIRASPAVRDAYHGYMQDDFYLSMLTARLQGGLTGGREGYLKGLDIIEAARRDDPSVSVGSFTLTLGGVSVPLRNWLALVKYDDKQQEDGVVLYNTKQNKWELYNSQSDISQHLDLRRLGQTVRSSAATTANDPIEGASIPLRDAALSNVSPSQKSKMANLLHQIIERPDSWRTDYLSFTPYPVQGFTEGLTRFSNDLLDNRLLSTTSALRNNPQLIPHLDDNRLLGEALQNFIREKLPFSLSLDEFARQRVSADIAPWFVSQGIVGSATEFDASTIQVTFNGVTASMTDWTLSAYRQAGDLFWGESDFKQDATFESTIGQDLSKLRGNQVVKESLEGYLRRTYLGTQYIQAVDALLTPGHAQQKEFQSLRVAKEISDVRIALEQGQATGYIDASDYQRIKRLLTTLPAASATSTGERIAYFAVGGKRIPGLYEIILGTQGKPLQVGQSEQSFVYLPQGFYGQTLFEKHDFIERLKDSPVLQENLLNRSLIKDRTRVDSALRAIKNTSFIASPLPISGNFLVACDQLVKDKIANADELTTSRLEMIGEQSWKGLGYALAPVCMAAGPVAVATCALGTSMLTGKNIYDISEKVDRGELGSALWEAAFIWTDASDIGAGIRPLAKGLAGLRKTAGKAHFTSVDEVIGAIKVVKQSHRQFLPNGRLDSRLAAVNTDDTLLYAHNPRETLTGDFYAKNGKYYIKDGVHKFEVYSDSGWQPDTIRVRDPSAPNSQGPLIQCKNGVWLRHQPGLLGGGDSSPVASDLGPIVGAGGEATIYQSLSGPSVYKQFKDSTYLAPPSGHLVQETQWLNLYYRGYAGYKNEKGDFAEAIVSDGMGYIKMGKLPGKSLNLLPKNSLPPESLNDLKSMLTKMEEMGIHHQDLQLKNIMYGPDGTFYPVDIQSLPEHIFAMVGDAPRYTDRKNELLEDFMKELIKAP